MSGLNLLSNLEFLEAATPQELLDLIKSIPTQISVVTIYEYNGKHIAWVQGKFKKVKTLKENKNG